MLLDLSYNFPTLSLGGGKQSDSYRLLQAEISVYIAYLISDFKFSLGVGESSLYTKSTTNQDNFIYYSVQYYPFDFLYIGAEQHFYERTDAENFFLYSVGITYTTDWK